MLNHKINRISTLMKKIILLSIILLGLTQQSCSKDSPPLNNKQVSGDTVNKQIFPVDLQHVRITDGPFLTPNKPI